MLATVPAQQLLVRVRATGMVATAHTRAATITGSVSHTANHRRIIVQEVMVEIQQMLIEKRIQMEAQTTGQLMVMGKAVMILLQQMEQRLLKMSMEMEQLQVINNIYETGSKLETLGKISCRI